VYAPDGRGEGPVDGGLAAALAVAGEVEGEELAAEPGAQVAVLLAEEFGGFAQAVVGGFAPDHLEHALQPGDDVAPMPRIVHQNAVPRDVDGVGRRDVLRPLGRQVLLRPPTIDHRPLLQHPRRAHWKRVEG
jgi:hypothetical protein